MISSVFAINQSIKLKKNLNTSNPNVLHKTLDKNKIPLCNISLLGFHFNFSKALLVLFQDDTILECSMET